MMLSIIEYAQSHPYLLYATIIVSTYISEDVAIISTATLITSDHISILPAFLSLILGITSGDSGLYWLGHICQKRVRWINNQLSKQPAQKLEKLISHNMFFIILCSRFMPGFRLPCYLLCGIYRLPFLSFLFYIAGASILWIVFIFTSINTINKLNGAVSPWLTALILISALLVLRFLIRWYTSTKTRKH